MLRLVEHREVIEAGRHVGMSTPQCFLAERELLFREWNRLLKPTFLVEANHELMEAGGFLRRRLRAGVLHAADDGDHSINRMARIIGRTSCK
jgi:hypothetical protein